MQIGTAYIFSKDGLVDLKIRAEDYTSINAAVSPDEKRFVIISSNNGKGEIYYYQRSPLKLIERKECISNAEFIFIDQQNHLYLTNDNNVYVYSLIPTIRQIALRKMSGGILDFKAGEILLLSEDGVLTVVNALSGMRKVIPQKLDGNTKVSLMDDGKWLVLKQCKPFNGVISEYNGKITLINLLTGKRKKFSIDPEIMNYTFEEEGNTTYAKHKLYVIGEKSFISIDLNNFKVMKHRIKQ